MSKESFKNRHGKIVTVEDEAVTIETPQEEPVVSVDAPEQQAVAEKKSKKKAKTSKNTEVRPEPEVEAQPELVHEPETEPEKEVEPEPVAPVFEAEPIAVVRSDKKKRLPKSIVKRIITTVLVVAAIGVAAFILMTQTAAQQHASAESRMKDAVKQALSIKLKTEVGLDDALNQLLAAMPAIECPKLGIFELSSQSRQAHRRCQSTHSAYESIRTEIKDIKPVAAYSQAMRETLSAALTNPQDGNFAEIAKYADLWQEAELKIKNLDTPKQITSGHAAVVEAVSSVSSAWQKLQAANNSRDSVGYTAAKEELSAAYERLRSASDQVLVDLLPLQKRLSAEISVIN